MVTNEGFQGAPGHVISSPAVVVVVVGERRRRRRRKGGGGVRGRKGRARKGEGLRRLCDGDRGDGGGEGEGEGGGRGDVEPWCR